MRIQSVDFILDSINFSIQLANNPIVNSCKEIFYRYCNFKHLTNDNNEVQSNCLKSKKIRFIHRYSEIAFFCEGIRLLSFFPTPFINPNYFRIAALSANMIGQVLLYTHAQEIADVEKNASQDFIQKKHGLMMVSNVFRIVGLSLEFNKLEAHYSNFAKAIFYIGQGFSAISTCMNTYQQRKLIYQAISKIYQKTISFVKTCKDRLALLLQLA